MKIDGYINSLRPKGSDELLVTIRVPLTRSADEIAEEIIDTEDNLKNEEKELESLQKELEKLKGNKKKYDEEIDCRRDITTCKDEIKDLKSILKKLDKELKNSAHLHIGTCTITQGD